ncbi:MAG: S8 family serine peptidase [Pseudomonadota bacterium]
MALALSSIAGTALAAAPTLANKQLIDKATEQGGLPVIVKLAVDTQIESFLSEPQVIEQRNKIDQTQDQVIGDLQNAPGRVGTPIQGLKRFAITPAFAMLATADDINRLLANNKVLDVVEDIPVPPTLTQSIPLIGGSVASGFSGYTGSGQTVAILDTGVEKTHDFMDGKVVSEACYSSNYAPDSATSLCPGGVTESTASGSGVNCTGISGCDHGTHVAGIAAGRSSTMTGVAKNASIIAVQVFSRFDNTTYCGGASTCVLTYNSDQIRGLERVYALRSTYNIAAVNMSLGGGKYTSYCDSDSRKTIIDQLAAAGIATVIASGNSSYTDAVGAPGCISTAVTVGSTTKDDVVASYSNSASMVDLLAPGSSIYSSITGNAYGYKSGTSMATPHVAGAFAVLKSASPSATVSQAQSALQSTGVNITDGRNSITKPRIQVDAAVNQIIPGSAATPADFNGDSKSDLLLYTQSNGGGTVMRLMNGATVSSSNWLGYAGTNRTMYPADFSGDGKSDIAIYNFTDGGLVMWMMNGATRTSAHWLGYAGTAREVFAADFNGDKKSDLLFYDPTTGGLVMWIMNGATRTSAHWLGYYANSQLTTGDFNGDGKADILFRNASDGGMVMRMMNGATISSAHWLGYRANTAVFAGDFNADGKDDLLLQNTADRGLVLWMMNGASISSAHWLGYAPQPVRFANRDFNGDGKADILMRNTSDGGSIMWIMNGATRTSANWMGYLTDLY